MTLVVPCHKYVLQCYPPVASLYFYSAFGVCVYKENILRPLPQRNYTAYFRGLETDFLSACTFSCIVQAFARSLKGFISSHNCCVKEKCWPLVLFFSFFQCLLFCFSLFNLLLCSPTFLCLSLQQRRIKLRIRCTFYVNWIYNKFLSWLIRIMLFLFAWNLCFEQKFLHNFKLAFTDTFGLPTLFFMHKSVPLSSNE